MKTKLYSLTTIILTAFTMQNWAQDSTTNAAPVTAEVASTSTSPADEVVPLITVEDAPLADAIRTLARQAEINLQFDPKVLAGTVGPDGKSVAPSTVSFRWKDVTPLQALHAVLDNNNLQLVQDSTTKIARVTPKDPAALEPIFPRVISLRYSNPTNIIPLVTAALGTNRSRVMADTRTSQLVVLATEKEQAAVNEIIARIDTSPSQILIEARFLETTKNPRSAKGVDWTGTLANQNVSFGNNFNPGTAAQANPGVVGPSPITPVPANPLGGILDQPTKVIASTAGGFTPGIGFLNADGVSAVVSFLNTDNEANTLATPRAVALEGVPTELSVVRNIPIFEEQQGANTGGTQNANTVKPNYNLMVRDTLLSEVGIKLMVTPRIYGVSNVFLDLKPEISERDANEVTTLGGKPSSAPTFLRKRIQTQAMVPSGQTLVLGGLRQDGTQQTRTKVPLLGDIPGLGKLFSSNTKARNKRDLLIFVTPTILGAADYQPAPEARNFLQKKGEEKPDLDWSAIDSVEPHDWKKPVE